LKMKGKRKCARQHILKVNMNAQLKFT